MKGVVVAAALLLLASCGGDRDSATDLTSPQDPQHTQEPTSVPTSPSPAPSAESIPSADPFDPGLDRVAKLFIAFAVNKADGVPVDTPLGLYLGNVYQKTIASHVVEHRDQWDACDDYVDSPCPFSPLDAIAASRGVRIAPGPATSKCLVADAPDPTDTGAPHVVTITPRNHDCEDDFAVQLWVNDVGQITAVNLLLAGRS